MEIMWGTIGVVGSVFCVAAYFLLERGRIESHEIRYYALNGIGAFLVLIAALADFDGGDLGAVTQELCWCAISFAGITRLMRSKKEG